MNEWLAEISLILISYLSSIVKCCPCSQYGVMDLILVQKSYSKPSGNENREQDKLSTVNTCTYTIQACQFSVRYSVLRPDMQERGGNNLATFQWEEYMHENNAINVKTSLLTSDNAVVSLFVNTSRSSEIRMTELL